jgi:non-specific serine/threonine protein kinase
VARRAELVERFQEPLGPPFFVISLRAGGTGLNLTAASHVIHLDRWWNPAVENQATDRAYRIGQTRTVLVHKFVCPGTIEERIDAMLGEKLRVADQIVGPADVSADWMELDDGRLLAFLAYDGSGLSE